MSGEVASMPILEPRRCSLMNASQDISAASIPSTQLEKPVVQAFLGLFGLLKSPVLAPEFRMPSVKLCREFY